MPFISNDVSGGVAGGVHSDESAMHSRSSSDLSSAAFSAATRSTFPPQLIACITSVFEEWCKESDAMAKRSSLLLGSGFNGGFCRFRAVVQPQITVKEYVQRIHRYAECSDTCFILALIYLDRLRSRPENPVIIDSLSVHRFLITSIMLAAKFFDDRFYRNSLYAFVGGVSTQEINQLEVEMFSLLNYNVSVTVKEYYQYDQALRNHSNSFLMYRPVSNPKPISGSNSPVSQMQQDFQQILVLQHHQQQQQYQQHKSPIAYTQSVLQTAEANSTRPFSAPSPTPSSQSSSLSHSFSRVSTPSPSRLSQSSSSSMECDTAADCSDDDKCGSARLSQSSADYPVVTTSNYAYANHHLHGLHNVHNMSGMSDKSTFHHDVSQLHGTSADPRHYQTHALTRSTSVPAYTC